MSRRLIVKSLLVLFGVVVTLGAFAKSVTSQSDMPRYLGHLSTDKPIYRIGERVYFRGVVLGAIDHTPLAANQQSMATLQITGPKGEIVANTYGQIEDSVAAFTWDVPEEMAGGQYKARVNFSQGYPPAERKFEIRAYRAPRLKGEIVFLRDGYGVGDTVKASLHVERAEGGLPAGAAVSANALVDGADVYTGKTQIDKNGNCSVEFALPKEIKKGDGTLSLAIADGGVVEPITKTIPILVKSLDVAMYPEGGDLIAGLACRVYLEAKTPALKPADLVGTIVDSKGEKVADVRTEHEGRARFSFTPKAGESYSLKISQPAGIEKAFELPVVRKEGVVLHSDADVVAANAPITFQISSTSDGSYTVSLTKRQSEIASLTKTLTSNKAETIQLTPPSLADGVLVATVKNYAGTPVAERLIFRKSAHALQVKITPDKSSYIPGDATTIKIITTDDGGKPIGAVVGLTATDESVLQMIEKRERAPRLPAMVFLENDVKDLADADVYLDATNPKSSLAVDLLLGTQGWRRFADANDAKFLADFGDDAWRTWAFVRPPVPAAVAMPRGGVALGAIDEDGAVAVAAPVLEPAGEGRPRRFAGKGLEKKMQDKEFARQGSLGLASRANKIGAGGMFKLEAQAQAAHSRFLMPPTPPIRIYAHELRVNRKPEERTDFTETVYWSAGVKTDEKTGEAKVSFKLNDSVTSFKIAADAFDQSGAIGEGATTITSVQPFYLEPKLPLEVSANDRIRLPIAIVNSTANDLQNIALALVSGKGITTSEIKPFDIPANSRTRILADVNIADALGSSNFIIKASAGDHADSVTRKISVKPLGFPIEIARGGMLEANSTASYAIEIPDSLVPGSVSTSIALYPTPVGNLTEALTRLMQEPSGCFEQTTSTTYPLIMAQQYFKTHSGVDPQIIAKSNDLLAKGYDRLKGFECKNKGYEWFGEDPGHECLSAYGLLEFADMSQVREVDQSMLGRTRQWLLARRDKKGGFTHERRALHTWTADTACSNGYVTWALLETGEKDLEPEIKSIEENAKNTNNSYVIALAANALSLAGDPDAKALMDKLASLQDKDGHVKGAVTTVVGSGGESLEIETTSLATLAWLRDSAYAANIEHAIKFLADSCKAGRYGSTQSTVLALRAIINYDKARAHPTAAGKAQLIVDGNSVEEPVAFDATTQGALKLPDISKKMTPGKHTIAVKMIDGSNLPFAIAVNFNSVTPSSSEECKVRLATALKDATISEGAVTDLNVTISNTTSETIPTPIAIIGIPGGLEIRHDQLKELVKADRIAAYEVRGRETILYWRDMQAQQTIQIPLSVTASIPGTYTAPASRAYLYYTDEHKHWVDGCKVTVTPK